VYANTIQQQWLTTIQGCGDVLTKKKLDPHANKCRGASFTCIDCMVHFWGTEYRAHTSCMSEAQKYQGHLYRGEKKKGGQQQNQQQKGKQDQAMVPKAYVEDAPEEGESLQAVAVIDVPPRAPTPPPVNVFDFLVQDATPKAAPAVGGASARKMLERESSSMYVNHPNDSQYSQYSNGEGATYKQRGYSYGDAPVQPTFERYDSLSNVETSQASLMPGAFETPAPKKEKKDKSDKSDKKRKRHVDDLDLSAAKRPASRDEPMADAPAPPSTGRVLHSGLTGGLSRLVTDPDFYEDRIDAGPTPISPLKRSKRNDHTAKDKDSSRDDKRKSSYVSHGSTTRTVSSSKHSDETSSRRRRHRSPSSSPEPSAKPKSRTTKAIEYPTARAASVQPSASNQVGAHYNSRAELFMSFVNKGPDSERGVSINKALKRYHREKGLRALEDKEDEDKELWKDLRLRKNERGEIVLFF
jgi:cell growth-regulating nucleolar protein